MSMMKKNKLQKQNIMTCKYTGTKELLFWSQKLRVTSPDKQASMHIHTLVQYPIWLATSAQQAQSSEF